MCVCVCVCFVFSCFVLCFILFFCAYVCLALIPPAHTHTHTHTHYLSPSPSPSSNVISRSRLTSAHQLQGCRPNTYLHRILSPAHLYSLNDPRKLRRDAQDLCTAPTHPHTHALMHLSTQGMDKRCYRRHTRHNSCLEMTVMPSRIWPAW